MAGSKRTPAHLDADPTLGVGQPGYRTQPGRSGYDPVETNLEAAHVAGVLLRKLLSSIGRLFGSRRADRR
jgi:hypothetical protein